MNAIIAKVILIGPLKPLIVKGLDAVGTVHKTAEAKDRDAFYAVTSPMSGRSPAAPRPNCSASRS